MADDAPPLQDPAELRKRIAALAAESPVERREAAEALAAAAHPQAAEALRRIVNDPDLSVRYVARRSLKAVMERIGESLSDGKTESDVGERLGEGNAGNLAELERLLGDADPKKRMSVLKTVGVKRIRVALPLLLARIDEETDPFIIATMVKVIGVLGDGAVLPVLSRFLASPDPRVRANTVEGISFVHDNAKVSILEPLVDDPDNRIRANALMALYTIREPFVIDRLRGMLQSDLEANRESARFVIERIEAAHRTSLRDRFEGLDPALPAAAEPPPLPAEEGAVTPRATRDLYLKDITSILLAHPRIDVGFQA